MSDTNDAPAPASVRFVPPSPGAPTAVTFPTITRSTLSNGLQVWTIPHQTIPVTCVALVIHAGSAHDPGDRHGLASLVAHLAEEGAGGRDAIQLAEALARLGTHVDADAGTDVTTLSVTMLTRFFEPALRLLADVAVRPHLADADLVRVRELRVNRLLQLSRSPSTPADRTFLTSVFGDHPYGHGVLGTTKSVQRISQDDVRAFHQVMWQPSIATLIVAGQMHHDVVAGVAQDAFAGWQMSSTGMMDLPMLALPAAGSTEILLVDRPGAPQSELRVGHSGPPRGTADYHAMITMNHLLGGDFLSRINRNLREAKGLTYGSRSAFDMRRTGGSFACQTSVQTDSTAAAITEILRECEGVRVDGAIQADELARAKSSLTRGYVRHFEAADDLVRATAQLMTYGLPDDTYDQFVPRVEALNEHDIVDAARRYIRPDGFKIVVVGDASLCRPQLDTLGRSVTLATPEF